MALLPDSAPGGAVREVVETDALLRVAAGLSRLGAWALDVHHSRVVWSDAVREIHEVTPQFEPTFETAINFYPAEHAVAVRVAVERCISHGTAYDLELEITTARGRCVPVRVIGEAIRGRDGRVHRIEGAIQDLSKIKRLTQQNQLLADALASTLETMTDAFFLLDRDWRFSYVNLKAETLLQRRREDIIGKVVWDEFPQAVGSVFQREYQRTLQQGIATQFEAYYPPLDVWLQVRSHPASDGIAVYFQDITGQVLARRSLEKTNDVLEREVATRTRQLEAANRELATFSYSVSHDLKAPLAAIASFTQVLGARLAGRLDEREAGYLQKVGAGVTDMYCLIDALLRLSDITRATPVRLEPVDLTAIVHAILQELREQDPARRLRTRVQEGMLLECDRALLSVALRNLLGNAWKFSARKPLARISVLLKNGPRAGEARLVVRDNGAGFDPGLAGRMFAPFQRLHHASEFAGTGIGLATVQRIVHRHGGTIAARASLGRWAAFTITLPQAAQVPQESAEAGVSGPCVRH